jgi:alkylation response protein AidB-like acyl-CoA dehydrogenase
MRFVLHELRGYASLRGLADRTELSTDVADSILDGAAKLAAEVLRSDQPWRADAGESVRSTRAPCATPRGFAEGFRTFADGGWAVVAAHPEFGGQHLPHTLRALVDEMICSANLAFASYTMLIPGRIHRATHVRVAGAQATVSAEPGRWKLVGHDVPHEAQSGSDLSLVRTSATRIGRQLPNYRDQDFRIGRRARLYRQHRTSRPCSPARCAAGDQGHQSVRRPEVRSR